MVKDDECLLFTPRDTLNKEKKNFYIHHLFRFKKTLHGRINIFITNRLSKLEFNDLEEIYCFVKKFLSYFVVYISATINFRNKIPVTKDGQCRKMSFLFK